MNILLVRQLLEITLLLGAITLLILLFLSSIFDIRQSIWQKKFSTRHAKRQHITILIDAVDASQSEVAETVASISRNSYKCHDIVIICAPKMRNTLRINATWYAPRTRNKFRINEAYGRSKKGAIVLVLEADGRLQQNALTIINREFYFDPRLERIMFGSMIHENPSYRNYDSIIRNMMVQMLQRALSILGIYITRRTMNCAVKNEVLPTLGHPQPFRWIHPIAERKKYTISWLAGILTTLYVGTVVFVLVDFAVSHMNIQLATCVIFIMAATLLMGVSGTWHTTKTRSFIVFNSTGSFVVLFASSLVSLVKMIPWATFKRIM